MTNGKLLLTAKETAEALGIGERKLWSMTQTGEIPHLRIGNRPRYPVDQLKQWISDQIGGDSHD